MKMQKKTFRLLTFNPLDDRVEIFVFEAGSEEEARDAVEEFCHNLDIPVLMNTRRWRNLVRAVQQMGGGKHGG